MKKLRWQLVIIFLTGLVVGFLLLGEQPAARPFIPEPAQGGIYAEALTGSLKRLNPLLDFNNPVDRDVDRLIFSGMLKFDERGLPVPDLAEAWGISQDGTVYNISLRNGLKWHDGEPLTSDDILFTIDLIRDGGDFVPADLQDFWKNVDVKVLSPTAIQFRLQEPFAPFLDYLAFGVLPRHLLDGYALKEIVDFPFNLQPVGSGPYRLERLIVENNQITGLVLSTFSDYYGKKPFIDQVVFRYYPDGAASLSGEFKDGVVQGIGNITSDILSGALAEPNLSIYSGRKPELVMVLFNMKDQQATFMQDPKVRKALLTGLNRQWIVDHMLNGQAIIADGPILPGTWAFYDGLPHSDYDVEAANTMLKDAGYVVPAEGEPVRKKGETALSFTMLYPDTPFHKLLAEAIQADWTLLNVKVALEPVAYDELVNGRLQERAFSAALVDLNLTRSPDPDPYPFWDQAQATGGQNYSQWDNRTASEYLEQARTTSNVNERIRLYRNFQVIFSNETPAILLYYPVYAYGVDRQVQGVRIGPLFDSSDRFNTIQDWFLVSSRQQAKSTETPAAP